MPLETADLLQYGVLWQVQGADPYGSPMILSPIEFRCRWILGVVASSNPLSNVHTIIGRAIVDRIIAVESIVWKGSKEELDKVQEPRPLMKVVDYREVPSISSRHFRRTITLAAYTDKLPGGVN